MALWIDPPVWPAHGRLWAHLVSDQSVAELHAFAASQRLPRRGFERDHYDVPEQAYDALVVAGATPIPARELVALLHRCGLRRRKSASMAPRHPGVALVRPRRLRPGDLVRVPATSGVVPVERLRAGVQRLKSWGLRVQLGEHVLSRDPRLTYLAGSDELRAAELAEAWLDPEAAAVMVARGGYGGQRVADLLDWRRLAEGEPKLLIGFSDVTALHQAVASRLGVVSVHGHVVTSLGAATADSAHALRTLLMEPPAGLDLLAAAMPRALVGGTARGVLTGGNLAVLAADIATPYSRPARGAIVLLEDVGEEPYRLDRLVTQLMRAGWFEGVRGIVLGAFTDCGASGEAATVLEARLVPLGVPLVCDVDIGHTPSSRPVPFGVAAVLDADAGTLTLTDPPLL